MKELIEKLPEIINAGAQSPLGLISLAISAISIVAVIYFRNESGRIKLIAYSLMVLSLGFFLFVGNSSTSIPVEEDCLALTFENNNPKLQVSVVQHDDINSDKLRSLFIQLTNNIKEIAPSFSFNGVRLRESGYYDEPSKFEKASISTIRPAKYALLMDSLDVIPIFAVKKEGQIDPFYHASFISSKSSDIKDIRSDKSKIERIYVCAKTSLSGYIAPLNELFELGIIDSVSESAIKKIGWEIVNVQNHDLVLENIKQDDKSIGATGLYVDSDPRKAEVNLVHQYGRFPQDVLVISKDLADYKDDIQNWFERLEREEECKMEVLSGSSARISGFTRMNDVIIKSYRDLAKLYLSIK